MTSHVESVALDRYVDKSLDQEDARATTIALYQEGALEEADAGFVRSHLNNCEECTGLSESLREVAQALVEAPVPPLGDDMLTGIEGSAPPFDAARFPAPPSDLAERIDSALEAERRRNAAAEREQGHDAGQILALAPAASRPRRWAPYVLAAAAAVFLFGGGFAGITALLSEEEEAAAPPSADAPAEAEDEAEAALPYHPKVVESGTSYSGSDLTSDAVPLVQWAEASTEGGQISEEEDSAESEPTPAPSVPAELFSCIDELGVENGHYPVLVDLADYEGQPAWVMVYEAEEGEEYFVQAVASSCGTADSSDPEVLDSATLSRD